MVDIFRLKNFSLSCTVFKPEELRQTLMPTLEKIYQQDPEALPFRQIDPNSLGATIEHRAMDLSTIRHKLNSGQYSDPLDYVEDVWLMFNNAWLYNRKTSKVYRFCTRVSIFILKISFPFCRYCCDLDIQPNHNISNSRFHMFFGSFGKYHKNIDRVITFIRTELEVKMDCYRRFSQVQDYSHCC